MQSCLNSLLVMSPKTMEIIALCRGHGFDPHYLGYFQCFNQQLYFEAHEALENLWLPSRGRPEAAFYKGLIQLAGAFVHLQKGRIQPAAALLRLAKENLEAYSPVYLKLNVGSVLSLIENWRNKIDSPDFQPNSFSAVPPPNLELNA